MIRIQTPGYTGILIILLCVFRILFSVIHPPTVQHDRLHHHQYVRSLAHGVYEANYEGPYYYAIAAIHTKASRFIRDNFLPDTTRRNVSNGIIVTNALLFALLTFGLLKFFALLSPSKKHAQLITALCLSFPVLHRSFNMARPENFMLVTLIWGAVFSLELLQQSKLSKYSSYKAGVAALLLSLCITQKITGVVAVGALSFGLFFTAHTPLRFRLQMIGTILSLCFLCSTALWAAQYYASGSKFYSHHESCNPTCGPNDIAVLYRFSPYRVWKEPFRDAHRDSMLNILFADFYGDYWRYGIDAPLYGKRRWIRLSRIRIGLVAHLLFILFFLYCSYLSFRSTEVQREFKKAAPLLSVPLAGFLFLILACFITPYRQSEFDLIKWEYILWVLPFLTIPALFALKATSARKNLTLQWISSLMIFLGILQSIPLYHPWIMNTFKLFESNSADEDNLSRDEAL